MQAKSVKETVNLCIRTYCFSDKAHRHVYEHHALNSLQHLPIMLVFLRNSCLTIGDNNCECTGLLFE